MPLSDLAPRSAGPIRVLLVDDSPLALAVLKKILSAAPDIQVAATASTGQEALNLIPLIQPTLVCTDYHMPGMSGLELTRRIMELYPRPILVVSATVNPGDAAKVFELIEAGAVDFHPKPVALPQPERSREAEELISKLRVVARVFMFSRGATPGRVLTAESPARISRQVRVVLMGASTGGPQALDAILTKLHPDFPAPICCVQHISAGFLRGLVDWLARRCRLPVQIAREGETPRSGVVYFPPENTHLEFHGPGKFHLGLQEAKDGHRPSASVLFSSGAESYGAGALGVLLSGMGRDGASGLLAIARAGGMTIAQDEASSVVFGMPKQAIDIGAARLVLPLDEIAPRLISLCSTGRGGPAAP